MIGELRALGLAHGLLLGLLLASPMIAPDLLPWGVEALFIVGGFQMRLADRRGPMRDGWRGWTSHIRRIPQRLIPWVAAATVALIAGSGERAEAILIAALAGELLIYPVCAPMLARLSRRVVGMLLMVLLLTGASVQGDAARYVLALLTGVSACMIWMRGPDSDAPALTMACATMAASIMLTWLAPPLAAIAFPASVVCATLVLAHLSMLRRRPLPWQANGGAPVRRLRLRLPSRPA